MPIRAERREPPDIGSESPRHSGRSGPNTGWKACATNEKNPAPSQKAKRRVSWGSEGSRVVRGVSADVIRVRSWTRNYSARAKVRFQASRKIMIFTPYWACFHPQGRFHPAEAVSSATLAGDTKPIFLAACWRSDQTLARFSFVYARSKKAG